MGIAALATRARIAAVLVGAVGVQVALGACAPPGLLDARSLLVTTWQTYEHDLITSRGQVVDPLERTGWMHSDHVPYVQTTSEGQSYAMLRAVWMGDRAEFDRVWAWTREHLQVRHDHLLAWLWAPGENDTWGVAGSNSASDADEDTALALVFAGHRWHDPGYVAAARAMLADIWRVEVVAAGGTYYMTAGSWAPYAAAGIVVDPSYLAPYEYRVFAAEDPRHPWAALADSSYATLRACSWAPLGRRRSVGLPPNWCLVGRGDHGAAAFATMEGDDYGYDAFRVMWRVAMDALWFHTEAARRYLQHSGYLRQQWARHGWLAAQYRHDGSLVPQPWEDPSAYGADIGDFVVTDPRAALTLLQEKLMSSYHSQDGVAYWGDRWSYYQQNWAWFGVALASGQLPNLASK